MILLVLYLFHEHVAKNVIPYYRLQYEAREAANRFIELYENNPETFYNLTMPLISSV